jgi:predicted nucleic acid-binding protein
MSLIVDASVAVKWLADEPGSVDARALGNRDEALIAPELVIAEVGNALWKKSREGILTRAQAMLGLRQLPLLFHRLHADITLSERALEIAHDARHPIYDCFYIALAEHEDAPLITADERQLVAARKAKVKVRRL